VVGCVYRVVCCLRRDMFYELVREFEDSHLSAGWSVVYRVVCEATGWSVVYRVVCEATGWSVVYRVVCCVQGGQLCLQGGLLCRDMFYELVREFEDSHLSAGWSVRLQGGL